MTIKIFIHLFINFKTTANNKSTLCTRGNKEECLTFRQAHVYHKGVVGDAVLTGHVLRLLRLLGNWVCGALSQRSRWQHLHDKMSCFVSYCFPQNRLRSLVDILVYLILYLFLTLCSFRNLSGECVWLQRVLGGHSRSVCSFWLYCHYEVW